jgi:hypothetical protein
MKFVFGMVDGDGETHILTGDAKPSLADVAHACTVGHEWGPEASVESSTKTAYAILHSVTQLSDLSNRLAERYAREVVSKMTSGVGWLLDVGEVEAWVRSKTII